MAASLSNIYSRYAFNTPRNFLNGAVFVMLFLLCVPLAAKKKKAEEPAKTEERTVINIDNAQQTRYEKDKDTGNDVIILSGNVKLSVTKGDKKNSITADVVRYDRKSDMIYADGNVQLEQTTANSGGQHVSANALMFNTATLEGVFDDGRVVQVKSDAINLPSGSTLIVASDIFGRSQSNAISFKNGVLTFCDDEDPHWKIKASRIWLLPGGEFAFLNALLFIGPVPVVWLPAFYYPKDELIFNPVFGNAPRKGYFIQTTAYVIGHKPLQTTTTTTSSTDSDASEKLKALFNFVKPNTLKEQEVQGLMLHNLDADYKGNTSTYVKVMADYYANLGIMAGVDGVVSTQKISNITFSTRLGFSNTVIKLNQGDYTPYMSDGERVWDRSSLLGFDLPFRYQANLGMSISNPFSLSLTVPLYSDPYFVSDFMEEREESMDWISYVISNTSQEDDENKTINETSSFTWTLNSSYSVPLPAIVKPYLNNISFSLSSSVAFSTMSSTFDKDDSPAPDEDFSDWSLYTPERKFYYPSQITPVNFSSTISGTIFDLSIARNPTNNKKTPSYILPPYAPDHFLTVKELADKKKRLEEEEQKRKEKEALERGETLPANNEPNVTQETEEKKEEPLFCNNDPFPVLDAPGTSITLPAGLDFKSTYSIKPSLVTQLSYSSTGLKTSSDFDWNVMRSSMYTYKMPITIDNTLSYAGSFFTFSNSWTYDPIWQEHPYINDDTSEGGYDDNGKFSLEKTDYTAQKQDLTNTNSMSLKPFAFIPLIKDSGVTWRTTIRMVRTEFQSDKYKSKDDTPEWIYYGPDFTDEKSVTTNDLDMTLALNELDGKFTQSYTLTATMSPQVEAYNTRMSLVFPYVTLDGSWGMKRTSLEDDTWMKNPFTENCNIKLFNGKLSLSQSYSYNIEDYHDESLRFSLSWSSAGLTASYSQQWTTEYDFDDDNGWVAKSGSDNKSFQPYQFSLTYAPATKYFYVWKNRIAFGLGLNTNITADLVRPTNTSFTFSPSISFKIHEILTLTFSATSKNQVIYRYFRDDKLAGETNLFKDLINSFRFDDEELRSSSGFKLQSLQLDVTHELHDWDLKFTMRLQPRLVGTGNDKEYQMNPYISLSVVWRPMAAMKTEILHDDEKNEWRLK